MLPVVVITNAPMIAQIASSGAQVPAWAALLMVAAVALCTIFIFRSK